MPDAPAPSPGGVTVAFDALGAERGQEVVEAGVREAAGDGVGVRVFGDPDALAGLRGVAGVELVEARRRITNDDEPVAAVRSTPDASIVRAAADVAAGRSGALASPGPT